jgi:hypothetical protein
MRSILASVLLVATSAAALAAGTDVGKPFLFGEGIACDASLLPWRSVWYGHFSGGTALYAPNSPAAQINWQDEKLCFPSRYACLRWQHAERRSYHDVHGDWTCLPLR